MDPSLSPFVMCNRLHRESMGTNISPEYQIVQSLPLKVRGHEKIVLFLLDILSLGLSTVHRIFRNFLTDNFLQKLRAWLQHDVRKGTWNLCLEH